jgi:pimeloyl-ACP methyl ester carboxylesterase
MTMSDAPTLLLFPGLGADARTYGPQRSLPVRLEFAEWPEPESATESLAHYSQRLAEAIGPRGNVYVGGVSLGAMVALEAARLLNARGVILIGGCTSGRQISPLFRSVLKASSMMPTRFVRPALRLSPLAFLVFERLSREHRRLMTRMLREHSPEQVRWSCRAILEWECCAMPPEVPVHAIHGQDDEVVPLRNVRADQVVPGGRHMISLQAPEEVNRFVVERIGAAERSGRAPGKQSSPAQ